MFLFCFLITAALIFLFFVFFAFSNNRFCFLRARQEEHGEDLSQGERGIPRWHCVSSLSESRRGVCDVKFSPLHLGLQIAAASEDGYETLLE